MSDDSARSLFSDENVHQALTQWLEGDGSANPIHESLLWRQTEADPAAGSILGVTAQVLTAGLDALETQQPEQARLLRLRFVEGESGYRIANRLHMAEGTVWRKQREAIGRLAEVLAQQEAALQTERRERFAARLSPPNYARLFGVEKHAATLIDQLLLPGPPWIVTVAGIGGIGKTTLADAVTRRMLAHPRWHDFAWVTARQERFDGGGAIRPVEKPALTTEALLDGLAEQLLADEVNLETLAAEQKQNLLQERLRARPHLVVIDNLETLLDFETLIATVRTLTDPTKFLFTSRNNRIYETDLFLYTVTELEPPDALALVRAEAALRNVPAVAAADDEALMPIVETVGGNPLALRLVAGQLHVHSLDRVLDDLRAARGHRAREIYTYIYHRIWHELDEAARRVLLLMPLVTEQGGDIDYLIAMGEHGGLSAADVGDALDRLVQRSLVDSRGDLQARRYTIHALTRTFLQEQVLQWTPGIGGAEESDT